MAWGINIPLNLFILKKFFEIYSDIGLDSFREIVESITLYCCTYLKNKSDTF